MSNRLTGSSGPIITLVLAAIPVFIWLPHVSVNNPAAFWLTLSQFTAISGYALYCLNFILSARLKFLEPFFSGLNRVYVFHHLVGVTAFILILIHPLAIVISYLNVSFSFALSRLALTTTNLPVHFGALSLALTILLLIFTLFVKLEYDTWKKTHKYLGLALFLASFHVFFMGRALAASPPLKIYLLALTIVALACYAYRSLFSRFFVKRHACLVSGIRHLSPHVIEITLTPKSGRPLGFHPGQFVFIEPRASKIPPQSHPFSIVSSAGSLYLTLAAKIVGDFTAALPLLAPGSTVLVEGPFGYFSYVFYPFPRQLWIAGGIGVTPFVSLAKSLPNFPYISADFYYTAKDKSEAIYSRDLASLARSLPNFRFHLHLSKDEGRLTASRILQDLPDLTAREIFVCGPPSMMSSLRSQLKQLGLKNSRIHTEEFSLS